MKKPIPGQSSFDFEECHILPTPLSEVEQYVEQIARDMATLRMDPTFIVPNREFYEDRIAAYQQDVLRMRATSSDPTMGLMP